MDYNKLLRYDSGNGLLTWKPRPVEYFKSKRCHAVWTANFCGKVAGHMHHQDGRKRAVAINLNGKLRDAHRIIWEMVNGPIPEGMCVDHIDCDPFNNKLSNLRLATKTENNRNVRISKDNTSGYKGVCKEKNGGWRSRIVVDKREIHLGTYPTKELAAQAYAKAAVVYHGEFARIC